MPTNDLPAPGSRSPAEFQELLARFLSRIEHEGAEALSDFEAQHPELVSTVGRQLASLAEDLARPQPGLPERIGTYRVVKRLGAGGMGTVYLAEQTRPFVRPVAVKVVKLGMDTDRFASEIQALALLNHNGIAKVFEAGSDEGRPFFSMEYVPGEPLSDYCASEQLDLKARLRLFIDVCRAVEHAHQQGIIHRDLKPTNILVYGSSAEPVAKVIDFGLAKAIDLDQIRSAKAQGADSVPAGTLDYMSPEQVRPSANRVVDTRTDVYALGVVLYELLTGTLPLSLWQLGPEREDEAIAAIMDQLPPLPSARVAATSDSTVPGRDGLRPARSLCRQLAGDLDSIVMKALAKHRDERYSGVAQLADDIRNHLQFRPVTARSATRRYLLRKFVRRNLVELSATAAALLIIASLVSVYSLSLDNTAHFGRTNLYALPQYLTQLYELEYLDPPPARPEYIGALRAWLHDFEFIYSQRERMRAFQPDTGETVRDTEASWTSGALAQEQLRVALDRALQTLAEMAAPKGVRDDVLRRIEWAQGVVALTVDGAREQWERVRREIREDSRFPGLDLKPQVGLIPIGREPDTGLQQFALPLPGADPPTLVAGERQITATTCPVFVLLPGGDVLLGSQKDDPDGPLYDPERQAFEAPPRQVHIDPFFASRYEFNNGQWRSIDRDHYPWNENEVLHAAQHPVTNIDDSAMMHAVAWGMRLPTTDEWEYLARGGTAWPRWCGETAASLERHENLYGSELGGEAARGEGSPVPWSDGFRETAPVGHFPANQFLMHDTLGNACEIAAGMKDGLPHLQIRGSSWHEGARGARATSRTTWDGRPLPSIGFRPVISVQR